MNTREDTNDSDFFNRVKDYINTYVELKKLIVIEQVVKTVSSVVSGLILVVFALFFLIFISVAFAFYLGELLSSVSQGFFIVAGVYLLLVILITLMRKNYIQSPIVNMLIRKIFKKGA